MLEYTAMERCVRHRNLLLLPDAEGTASSYQSQKKAVAEQLQLGSTCRSTQQQAMILTFLPRRESTLLRAFPYALTDQNRFVTA